jgi:fatty-acyl-CoA synthase
VPGRWYHSSFGQKVLILTSLVAGRLAKFQVPRHVLFIDAADIPLTPSGRPRKFLLAERARAELGLPRPGS